MAGGDWSRTSFTDKERGGCTVSSFDIDHYRDAYVAESEKIDPDTLWKNLEYFMERVLPGEDIFHILGSYFNVDVHFSGRTMQSGDGDASR